MSDEPTDTYLEIKQKALRPVRCQPMGHQYIYGLDGPPCPTCGSEELKPVL